MSYYIGFKFQINVFFAAPLCLETRLSKPRTVAARGCARPVLQLAPFRFRQLLTASSQSLLSYFCLQPSGSQMSWMAQGLSALISSTGNSKDGSSYHLLGNFLTRAKQSQGSLVGSVGGWHLLPLYLRAVQSDSWYHVCCPHHLNRCVLATLLLLLSPELWVPSWHSMEPDSAL